MYRVGNVEIICIYYLFDYNAYIRNNLFYQGSLQQQDRIISSLHYHCGKLPKLFRFVDINHGVHFVRI